ncbi:MAG: hypothetical protein Q9208_005340 [Pyrenodesmia sp. 3 TL-2023]
MLIIHSLYTSTIYAIEAGPSNQLFFAHANALAKSEVLKKEIEGSWKENAEKKIYWPHWKVSTVERFLEWLYTADYTCPYPQPVPAPAPTSSEQIEDDSTGSKRSAPQQDVFSFDYHGEDGEWPVESTAKKQKMSTTSPTLKPLQDLTWSGDRCQSKLSQSEEYSRWTGHQLWSANQLDYENTLMAHAELYVIACHYLVDGLKAMSWSRLKAVLISMGTPTAGSPVTRNLMNLFQYSFEETGLSLDGEEPLRELLTTFAALHYSSFKDSGIEKWATSSRESDREFIADLMVKVLLRVEALEAAPGVAPSSLAASGRAERHDIKCPKCSWQQMHECTPACSGLVGSPASSFKTKFLGSTGPGIKR